jgi:hypothetical protein
MRHTESDLRELLVEYGEERAGREPVAHLGAIVRRGRRMRRTRRTVTAGAAVTVVATGLVSSLLAVSPRAGGTPIAQRPADSARVESGPELPEKLLVVQGALKYEMPLIHSQRFETMGVATTVTFTPTSLSTGYTVACADPAAWVVTEGRLKGGERGGMAGRCGNSSGGHHDRLSVPSDWLERPQSMQVWVFPADAPVLEVATAVKGCLPVRESRECDDTTLGPSLTRPEVRERLLAEVGERPGSWAIGFYDLPAGTEPVPPSESPGHIETPVANASPVTG